MKRKLNLYYNNYILYKNIIDQYYSNTLTQQIFSFKNFIAFTILLFQMLQDVNGITKLPEQCTFIIGRKILTNQYQYSIKSSSKFASHNHLLINKNNLQYQISLLGKYDTNIQIYQDQVLNEQFVISQQRSICDFKINNINYIIKFSIQLNQDPIQTIYGNQELLVSNIIQGKKSILIQNKLFNQSLIKIISIFTLIQNNNLICKELYEGVNQNDDIYFDIPQFNDQLQLLQEQDQQLIKKYTKFDYYLQNIQRKNLFDSMLIIFQNKDRYYFYQLNNTYKFCLLLDISDQEFKSNINQLHQIYISDLNSKYIYKITKQDLLFIIIYCDTQILSKKQNQYQNLLKEQEQQISNILSSSDDFSEDNDENIGFQAIKDINIQTQKDEEMNKLIESTSDSDDMFRMLSPETKQVEIDLNLSGLQNSIVQINKHQNKQQIQQLNQQQSQTKDISLQTVQIKYQEFQNQISQNDKINRITLEEYLQNY